MTIRTVIGWLKTPSPRWSHLRQVPMRQLWMLMLAVFLLFSVIGFYIDIINGGTLPYLMIVVFAIVSGLNATVWIIVLAKLPIGFIFPLIALQFVVSDINRWIGEQMEAAFQLPEIPQAAGLHFAGTAIMILVVSSYTFMARYMAVTGKESFRIKNELALAHSIQKTLVPPVSQITRCFEIYGISEPSEKVGGDLVDVVELSGGDTVAYLADIAGHGLQAGILMGMLKTSARTALTDGGGATGEGGAVLSQLMQRLNTVLPQVKEAHMYATFTAIRLNEDGQAFFGMAASPPLLHWSAARKTMLCIEEQQFPLGLLPVSDFPSSKLKMETGDLIVVATDGILEVTAPQTIAQKRDKRDAVEYGAVGLESIIARDADRPLPELAASMLKAVRSYGRQFDDQTLLLVRRRA